METVPCQFCSKPTRMIGTKQCDSCWELKSRMEVADPTVLRRITKAIVDTKKQDEQRFREAAMARAVQRLANSEE